MLNYIDSVPHKKTKKVFRMSTRLLVLVMIAIFSSDVYAQKYTRGYKDKVFINYVDQDLALNEYARLAKESEGKKKKRYLRLFFKALPRAIATFFKMTHYSTEVDLMEGFRDNVYYSTVCHYYRYPHNPWGHFHLELRDNCPEEEIPVLPISGKFPRYKERAYFTSIHILPEVQAVVPAAIYYEKLLSLGVGGFWDTDDITFLGMHISQLLYQDIALAVQVLEKKSDDEIASFWYFMYDHSHPGNEYDREFYADIFKATMPLSPRVAGLMKKAYDQLLSEAHCGEN
mgnify:CR=1 FL=1